MRYTARKTSKLKSIVVSIAACVALLLCTLFSLGAGYNGQSADAADRNDIRFVQVAAGEDFAIGLTAGGDLYGWSLRENRTTKGDANAASLGLYYTNTPTKIDVTFYVGPGTGATPIPSSSTQSYYQPYKEADPNKEDDRIVQIAATRNTAAFITAGRRIYTWGRDGTGYNDTPITNITGGEHNILLRSCTGSYVWYRPCIIDYNYYAGTSSNDIGLKNITPNNMGNLSIAGGEYNYIIVYSKNSSFYTYVWGSEMYAITNNDPTSYEAGYNYVGTVHHDLNSFKVLHTGISVNQEGAPRLTAVAGGYNVGYNDTEFGAGSTTGTSLSVRGKNFLTTQGATASSNDYNITQTITPTSNSGTGKIYADSDGNSNVLNAVIGAQAPTFGASDKKYVDGSNNSILVNYDGKYYGRPAAGSVADAYKLPTSALGTSVYASDGTTALGGDNYKAIHNAVSLGNDIGYGIVGGQLYAWGDNSQGQSGIGNNTTKHYATPQSVLSGKTIATVAAGKQLSGPSKPFNSATTLVADGSGFVFNNGENGADPSASARVTNDDAFISGAITTSGDLWVWSNLHKDAQQIDYGNALNDNTQFIAVYSGYGNYIFAITRLGKLVQIQATADGYTQTIHDKFNDGTKDMENWKITDATNSVTFTVPTPTAANREPALGNMTFYVGSGSASQPSIKLNGFAPEDDETEVSYVGNSLIKSNDIGDVYRILDPGRDAAITFTDTTYTGGRAKTLTQSQLTPVFKYKGGAELRPEERKNIFAYEFVYTAGSGVGIRITPVRSSKGIIEMTFYVARYDSSANFSITTNGPSSSAELSNTAVYYDYQQCTVEFTVDNTPSYVKFDDFAGTRTADDDGNINYDEKPNGNALIPLLDPNNEYNNKYSIALQDVTTGAKALVKYLTNASGNIQDISAENNPVYKAILDVMRVKDLGFPDSGKIEKGNLEYYLGKDTNGTKHNRNNAHDKYNDEYQFLFSDRDTDLLLFASNSPVTVGNTAVEGAINPITVTFDNLSTYRISDDNIANFSTDFLNLYGIYDFKAGTRTTDSGEVNTISFTYNTVLFTAKGRTNTIQYAESGRVDSYITTNSTNAWARSNVRVSEFVGNAASYDPDSSGLNIPNAVQYNNVMSVFAQPTVRLSQSKMTGQNNIVCGEAATNADGTKKNSYTLSNEYITNKGFRVGVTKSIDLSEFLDFTENNSIRFSYKNKFDNFSEFNNQFYDELNPSQNVVILSQNKIDITPTTTRPIYFVVTIQRFYANNKPFAGDNEKIDIVVNIPTITDFTLSKSNASTSFNISSPVTIDLFGRTSNPNAHNESSLLSELLDSTYTGVMTISDIATTNANVATAVRTSGTTTALTITPGTSGKATISFVVGVFGKTLPMQLSFKVAGITPVSGTIELSDVKSVNVKNLLTEIRKQNSFVSGVSSSYDIIKSDIDEYGKPAAIQFYTASGELVTENNGLPRFVGNVRLTDTDTDDPRIRLEINDNVVDNITDTYYMRVRFVDTSRGFATYKEYEEGGYTILSTSQAIISTKSVVMGGTDGTDMNNPYVVNIDCDSSKPQGDNTNSDWYTVGSGTDMKVRVPIRMLLNLIGEENPQDFKASLVRSDSSTANYMYYSIDDTARYIEITPLYNTEIDENGIADPVVISVSVTPIDAASSRTTRMLSFRVTVSGISTTLDKTTYTTIWLVAFFSSLGLLIIIFLIRMIIYWRKRAKQRALIKRNQELIKLRDRVHNKATSATREQIVKTKLKMNDPKYARMLGDIKRDRADAADSTGVVLENADMPDLSALDDKGGKKKKKKKGGKKSIAELKAELEAKKAAVLAAQNGGGMPPFGGEVPIDAQPYGMPDAGFVSPDQGFGGVDAGFGSPADAFAAQDIGGEIIFDAPDDGMQG